MAWGHLLLEANEDGHLREEVAPGEEAPSEVEEERDGNEPENRETPNADGADEVAEEVEADESEQIELDAERNELVVGEDLWPAEERESERIASQACRFGGGRMYTRRISSS